MYKINITDKQCKKTKSYNSNNLIDNQMFHEVNSTKIIRPSIPSYIQYLPRVVIENYNDNLCLQIISVSGTLLI